MVKLMKKMFGVLAVLLMVSTVAAQDLNYDQTTDRSSSFEDFNLTKESGFLAGADLSFLSFFDAPETVSPGQEVLFEFENTVSYAEDSVDEGNAIDNEGAKFVVEIYDCGSRCGVNDNFVEGIRFETLELLTGFSDGDVLKGDARYTVPSIQDGPMKATSYIWVQSFTSDGIDNDGDGVIDEGDEALISDSPAQEFVVEGDSPEGGDETVGPGAGDDQGLFDGLSDIPVVGLVFAFFGILLVVVYLFLEQ